MYDNIRCEYPLPLTDEIKALSSNWAEISSFQTKDLDNSLSFYRITEDGFLLEEIVEKEYVEYTAEELKTIKPKPWSVFKEINIKNKYDKKIEHHGVVNFYEVFPYTEDEDYWVEFNAYFIYGKIDRIELFKAEKHTSQKKHNLKWEEHYRLEQAKPWNKFKNTVRPLGWSMFWRFVAKCCHRTSELFAKLQYAIIRKML